jgi:hypothetical protein
VLERVVAAGIEDHYVDPVLRLGHLLEQEFHVDGGDAGGCLVLDLGVDRHQIVAPADLQSVARVVEGADAARGEVPPELDDRRLHRALGGVLVGEDGEAELLELLRHRPHVVHRVAQGRLAVGAVADHQGEPGFLARHLGSDRRHQGEAPQADPGGHPEASPHAHIRHPVLPTAKGDEPGRPYHRTSSQFCFNVWHSW